MTEITLFILDTLGVEIFENFMIFLLLILWVAIFYTILRFLGYIKTPLAEFVHNAINRIGLW